MALPQASQHSQVLCQSSGPPVATGAGAPKTPAQWPTGAEMSRSTERGSAQGLKALGLGVGEEKQREAGNSPPPNVPNAHGSRCQQHGQLHGLARHGSRCSALR
ncbi:hypothetical protein NDU88_001295 [Pleurodeles waltl]|uniref:Uncharacterized protein n=1 Tax=Pleurodeles waltl TaxID=8319 RepID=A0AAV7UTQ5_PLEWA|nr:hypothetical protein NDU88_001295 [Pleurodeles waltl]